MPDGPSSSFHTTRWTQVVAARGSTPEAKQALRELCETYYGPVELFVRRYRGGADDVRDLTHEFFAKLLEGDSLGNADRTRGRFRSYLLGAVKHFLFDRRDLEQSLKRGGGHQPYSLTPPTLADGSDADDSTTFLSDPQGFPSDAFFDRHWAVAVVEQAIAVLRSEAEESNDAERFEVLQRWLITPADRSRASVDARSLQMNDGAFKVAVHRLRKRFRQVIVDRIAATVHDPAEIQAELDYLVSALATPLSAEEPLATGLRASTQS